MEQLPAYRALLCALYITLGLATISSFMSNNRRTVQTLSYGLAHPRQLLEKLKSDADKLDSNPHPYDVFNFMVTAAVLAEWTQNYFLTKQKKDSFKSPSKGEVDWELPGVTEQWILDTSCFPNPHNGIPRHINNTLSICAHVANASKHFHWADKGHVETIGTEPPIGDWYQFFFTPREPDLYITYRGENYGLQQIKGILMQFYAGLLAHLEVVEPNSASQPTAFSGG